MTTQEEPAKYFGMLFCIAIVITTIGVGLLASGVWQGMIMIIASMYSWFLVGRDIIQSRQNQQKGM